MQEGRIRRLTEELGELSSSILSGVSDPVALVEELSYALRPPVHERRIPSYGAFIEPLTDLPQWAEAAGFAVSRRRVDELKDATARRFADGIVSWVVRRRAGISDLAVFDRSVGSERDLTILAEAAGAAIVQRHPNGIVRAIGSFGVLRYDGIDWQLVEPVDRWLDLDRAKTPSLDPRVFDQLLQFAVHDVAARQVGTTFVIAPGGRLAAGGECRYGSPPEFMIHRPADLAPLYHVLGQLDGAAVFDEAGTLRHLGVRLVPSNTAEEVVDPYRGTRHTSALRYSYDDPAAILIVVSEDGPVSVLQAGQRIGQSG